MQSLITFGNFRFERASARLWQRDAEVKLTRKAALVLGALLERPGEPVSKQALFASVWRGTVVGDDALVTCIQELRKALGDDSRQPIYIETRHRLGYRFAAPIADASPPASPAIAWSRSAAEIDPTAIAVLPFADMSPARDQDHLCEGLAEELIDALTHVDGLRVAARSSSFQFRGNHDLREVGRRLGVGSLLEGSVRKSGDRLRVTVQLIDVATGYHKWSEKFERSAADVFAVEDEIAATVAGLLRGGALDARERRALRRQPTAIETYECFLRGRQRMHTMQQPHMDEAKLQFERAIALDARYAPAWAGLAMLHALLYEWWGSHDADLEVADRASRIAMELAPELADAHLARAYTLSNLRRYAEACTHFEAAIRINPNLFDAWYYYGRAAFAAGDIEKSIELWHRGGEVRLDDFECPRFEAQSMCKLGRSEAAHAVDMEAIRRAERQLELNPHNARALSLGAGSLRAVGQSRRALEWVREAERLCPDDMAVIINSALTHLHLGLKDEALDRLERMFNKGWGKKDWVENDPDYDPLREEPRFKAMMQKLR
ncbi:MAG TPA: winged helix-turn-helix domain-containing protein [Steroidobacteraceae bacterium]|jgi:TolB-like protein/Tfp pilus assembly protein PilF|nr:winged helix-turn-helix domain-containing protein [Steroidobacteraceae bacterium]